MSKNKLRNIRTSTRACAIDLLILCENGSFANDIVPSRLKNSDFSESDRALITKVVYSTLRNQIRIDFALNKISKRPMEKADQLVRNALRSVASQIVDGVDAYAAVDETIKVLPFSFKSYVNAVARKISPLHKAGQFFSNEPEHIAASLPEWIVNEIHNSFDENSNDVIHSLNSPASVTIAPLNNQKAIFESALQGSLIETALVLENARDISSTDEFKNGNVIVMDQGSQLVALFVDSQPGEKILDVCSAPGGKTILMAQSASEVVASDISSSRLEKLQENVERTNSSNIKVQISDARTADFGIESFDRILIDAPCSGLGVLRRRPDARHRISRVDVNDLVQIQKEIIHNVYKSVKQGGYLIYSVCTFTVEETEQIDEFIAKEYPQLQAQAIDFDSRFLNKRGRGYQLTPTAEFDGMYLLKLRKE